MNNKKEGEYYSQMVRRFRNKYGGENLQDFCIKEKVSYTKMLHCLRRDSYQKVRQYHSDIKTENPGLRPLLVDHPLDEDASSVSGNEIRPYSRYSHNNVRRADISLSSGIRLSLHGCDEKKGVYHISWESFVYLLEGIVLRDRKVPFSEVEEAAESSITSESEISDEAQNRVFPNSESTQNR